MTAVLWLAGYLAAAIATAAAYSAVRRAYIRRQIRRIDRREIQIRRDVARFWAGRLTPPAVEQQPGDPYSDDRIAAELLFIPRQRRQEDHR